MTATKRSTAAPKSRAARTWKAWALVTPYRLCGAAPIRRDVKCVTGLPIKLKGHSIVRVLIVEQLRPARPAAKRRKGGKHG